MLNTQYKQLRAEVSLGDATRNTRGTNDFIHAKQFERKKRSAIRVLQSKFTLKKTAITT